MSSLVGRAAAQAISTLLFIIAFLVARVRKVDWRDTAEETGGESCTFLGDVVDLTPSTTDECFDAALRG